MSLLETAAALLRHQDIPHALIGAAALAVHGVSRATLDQDLLVTDRTVLDRSFWAAAHPAWDVDVRPGDAADPLAGVVRIRAAGERDLDIVVGKHAWQAEIVSRADVGSASDAPVVQAPDLVLLKLYAGGSQDRWDIEQLIALDTDAGWRGTVDNRVRVLPPDAQALWSQLRV